MKQDACLKRIREYSDINRDNPSHRNFRIYLEVSIFTMWLIFLLLSNNFLPIFFLLTNNF